MNRVIKFRVWSEGRFDYSSSSPNVRWSDDDYCPALIFPLNTVRRNQPFEIQQFTGLQDGNCKDIYEGDVIGSHASEKPCNYIVKWGETRSDYCGFVLNPVFINPPKFTHIIHNFKMWMAEDFEVLGNIFQSPELLA